MCDCEPSWADRLNDDELVMQMADFTDTLKLIANRKGDSDDGALDAQAILDVYGIKWKERGALRQL